MPTKLPLSMSPLSCPVSSQVVILVSIIIGFWFVFRHPGEVQPSCILGESEPWAVVVSTAWGACDSLSKHGQAVRVCVTFAACIPISNILCSSALLGRCPGDWTRRMPCAVGLAFVGLAWVTDVCVAFKLEPKSPVWAALRLVPSVGWFSGAAFLFHVI